MSVPHTELAKMIDHALLMPNLSDTEFDAGIRMARVYDVASVCVMPYYASRCSELLRGSTVKTSTVIGFPHGANTADWIKTSTGFGNGGATHDD